MKETDLIEVRNRNNGSTGYSLDGGFHREFEPKEVKKVPFSELKQLTYTNGGQFILDNYLVVESKEALELLNMEVEPEYFYTENDVKEILFNGSMDAFADFLDFAPEGAIEIAKTIAVNEQIPDVRKRDALSKRTGLNITNAIMVNEVMNSEEETKEPETKQRRVAVEKKEAAPKRRVQGKITICE